MGNYNVELFFEKNKQVFYVRPFTQELQDDLQWQMQNSHRASKTVKITEKDGTYAITSLEKITRENFNEGLWGILLRRFMAESKRVCIDPVSEEKYYAVIISHEFIKPCARRLAVA